MATTPHTLPLHKGTEVRSTASSRKQKTGGGHVEQRQQSSGSRHVHGTTTECRNGTQTTLSFLYGHGQGKLIFSCFALVNVDIQGSNGTGSQQLQWLSSESAKTNSSMHLVLKSYQQATLVSSPLYGHGSFLYIWLLLCVVDEPEEWFSHFEGAKQKLISFRRPVTAPPPPMKDKPPPPCLMLLFGRILQPPPDSLLQPRLPFVIMLDSSFLLQNHPTNLKKAFFL